MNQYEFQLPKFPDNPASPKVEHEKLSVQVKEERHKRSKMKTNIRTLQTRRDGPSLLPSDENLMKIKGRYFVGGNGSSLGTHGELTRETWQGHAGAPDQLRSDDWRARRRTVADEERSLYYNQPLE